MEFFRGIEYTTIEQWNEAALLAHNTCKGLKGYTSKSYSDNPIETTDNKFILVELLGFEKELLNAGFVFIDLDKSIIKVEDI